MSIRTTVQDIVRSKVDPAGFVLKVRTQDSKNDHGVVLWVRERPTFGSDLVPEYIIHRWATTYTDGSPIPGGLLYGGEYYESLDGAVVDFNRY